MPPVRLVIQTRLSTAQRNCRLCYKWHEWREHKFSQVRPHATKPKSIAAAPSMRGERLFLWGFVHSSNLPSGAQ